MSTLPTLWNGAVSFSDLNFPDVEFQAGGAVVYLRQFDGDTPHMIVMGHEAARALALTILARCPDSAGTMQ